VSTSKGRNTQRWKRTEKSYKDVTIIEKYDLRRKAERTEASHPTFSTT
jgi:hypothetical protein